MNILLINPPFNRLKNIYAPYFPLGLGYLAAVLMEQGHEVKIYNADAPDQKMRNSPPLLYQKFDGQEAYIRALEDASHAVWQELERTIRGVAPECIGITSTSPVYPAAKRIACIAKRINTEIPVVMGGFHPTLRPEEVLADGNVDFVVCGEGEETLCELMGAIRADRSSCRFERIRGIAYKKNDNIYMTERRTLLADLDSLPYPARHAEVTRGHDRSDKRMILASRGCPHDCAYCNSKVIWRRSPRVRNIDAVISEMEFLHHMYAVRLFEFRDELFFSSREKILAFCKKLRAKKCRFHWSCDMRIDGIDQEVIGGMVRAGCVFISVGLESGCEESLKKLNKPLPLKNTLITCRQIKDAGILLNINVMIGFPWEKKEDLVKTEQMIKMIKPHKVFVGVYTPLPGIDLNRDPYKFEIQGEDWKYFSFHSRNNFFIKSGLSREEFGVLRDRIIRTSDAHNKDRFHEYGAAIVRKKMRFFS